MKTLEDYSNKDDIKYLIAIKMNVLYSKWQKIELWTLIQAWTDCILITMINEDIRFLDVFILQKKSSKIGIHLKKKLMKMMREDTTYSYQSSHFNCSIWVACRSIFTWKVLKMGITNTKQFFISVCSNTAVCRKTHEKRISLTIIGAGG